MTATHARAARAERRAAAALGSRRVLRKRGESAPDVVPITLGNGVIVQPEVKSRLRLPRIITAAMEQAMRYAPGALPIVVLFERGRRAGIVAIDLEAFARLVGLNIDALPAPSPLRRRRESRNQLSLPLVVAA